MGIQLRLRTVVGSTRLIGREVRRLHLPFIAASLAYYVFVSLLPVLLLLFVVASVLGGKPLATSIADLAETYLTPSGQRLIVNAFENAADQTGVSLLSLAVLFWSLFRIFRSFSIAFTQIYDEQAGRSLFGQLRDAVVVSLALGVSLIATVVAGTVFVLFREIPYAGPVSSLALISWLALTLLPIYYVFPPITVSVREVVPGAITTAVGWASLEALFRIYLATTNQYQVYGIVGGVVLFVTWLYIGAFILLVGAVVNVVVAGRVDTHDVERLMTTPLFARARMLWERNR